MDGSRFDEIARIFASGASRRSIVKSLGGLIAGAALGTVGGRAVDAAATCRANNVICLKNSDCCGGLCGSKDSTGRQRCGCSATKDCPPAPFCGKATCSNRTCGVASDPTKIGVLCGTPASCDPVTNIGRTADLCGGSGQCVTGTSASCGYYVCGGTACLTTCSTDNDCVTGAHCDSDNVCRADHDNGVACDGPGDCISGHCVDGVCCNDECTDPCYRCDTAAIGICSAATGTSCSGGTCVGGSCCPSAQVCGSGLTALCGCGDDHCCGGACVPFGTKEHCSSCGDACTGNSDCCEGTCKTIGTKQSCKSCNDVCTGGDPECCADGCADLDVAINHCGACSNSCQDKGLDQAACCDGACTDLFNDIDHCGSCTATTCTGTTPDCCAGVCKDLVADNDNCGDCFVQCRASNFQHAISAECSGGSCHITACEATYTLIANECCPAANVCGSGDSATCCHLGESCCSGVCADTSVSTLHCGGCGKPCATGLSCAGGTCAQGSFGEPCTQNAPCSYTNSSTGDSCLNGKCCIPSGVECVKEQITFSGQCCSDTSQSCPSVGTCP